MRIRIFCIPLVQYCGKLTFGWQTDSSISCRQQRLDTGGVRAVKAASTDVVETLCVGPNRSALKIPYDVSETSAFPRIHFCRENNQLFPLPTPSKLRYYFGNSNCCRRRNLTNKRRTEHCNTPHRCSQYCICRSRPPFSNLKGCAKF